MKTFNLFPNLEKKCSRSDIEIHLNPELNVVYKVNIKDRVLEVNRWFQLLNPVVQEFIAWQFIYACELSVPGKDNKDIAVDADIRAFGKVSSDYGDKYEGLIFLAMKMLLPEDSMKGERLTNLYYQLANKNQ